MALWKIPLLFLIALLSGLVQGCTGFGSSIVAMTLLPLVMPFKDATVATAFSSFFMILLLMLRLRRYINFKLMLFPLIASILTSLLGVFALTAGSDTLMRRILGFVLILTSIFLILFSGRFMIRQTPVNGALAGAVSGFLNGLFNLGGPPMVMYLLSASEDKMEYNASLQFYFACNSVVVLISHLVLGNLNAANLSVSGIVLAGLLVGVFVGFRLFEKLSMSLIRKIIYGFMVAFGSYLILAG